MSFTGGDMIEAVCVHPTLGTLRFEPKGSEDNEVDRGGPRTEDAADSVTASGRPIYKINQVRWMVNVPVCGWDTDPDTLQNLTDLSGSALEGDWTFIHRDGTIDKGTGKPVGDIKGNKNAGTINAFNVSGGGVLERIQ